MTLAEMIAHQERQNHDGRNTDCVGCAITALLRSIAEPSEELVERVARNARNGNGLYDQPWEAFCQGDPLLADLYRKFSRAALRALAESVQ